MDNKLYETIRKEQIRREKLNNTLPEGDFIERSENTGFRLGLCWDVKEMSKQDEDEEPLICASCGEELEDDECLNTTCLLCKGEIK